MEHFINLLRDEGVTTVPLWTEPKGVPNIQENAQENKVGALYGGKNLPISLFSVSMNLFVTTVSHGFFYSQKHLVISYYKIQIFIIVTGSSFFHRF